jgi:GNAT superfamily N-acetyltransferase
VPGWQLPQLLRTSAGSVTLRPAFVQDVPAIVELLADDPIGGTRESGPDGLRPYLEAFGAIDADPRQLLLVAEADGAVVATLQLSLLPGLARRGTLRAQLEAIRVHNRYRGGGLGRAMIGWAIEQARRRGCGLVQLTSDKQRTEAHRFYAELGFVASHEGFKLTL